MNIEIEMSPDEATALLISAVHSLTLDKNDTVLKKGAVQLAQGIVDWGGENPEEFRHLVERLETSLLFKNMFKDGEVVKPPSDDIDNV